MIYLDGLGHLFSDVSVVELYEFAVKKLKMKSTWNHYSRNFPHFDITTDGMRRKAVALGAREIDLRHSLVLIKKVKSIYTDSDFPLYESIGLVNQKIYRIDYSKYFEQQRIKNGKAEISQN